MINISISALIGYLILAAYLGVIIGEVKAAIASQKELNRQKELTNEYAKIVSEMTASIQDYIEINNKEDADGKN